MEQFDAILHVLTIEPRDARALDGTVVCNGVKIPGAICIENETRLPDGRIQAAIYFDKEQSAAALAEALKV